MPHGVLEVTDVSGKAQNANVKKSIRTAELGKGETQCHTEQDKRAISEQ
jgi:hypothetical protein